MPSECITWTYEEEKKNKHKYDGSVDGFIRWHNDYCEKPYFEILENEEGIYLTVICKKCALTGRYPIMKKITTKSGKFLKWEVIKC
jgi:hypothetical protein